MRGLRVVMAAAMAFALSHAFSQTTEQRLNGNTAKISLADARGRIDKAIASSAVMKAIMKHLNAEDQKQFLADVNKAIADMPASDEEKALKFVETNLAALGGMAKGNATVLLAEMFATVPPEYLTVLQERLADGPMSRDSIPGVSYSDAQMEQIATATVKAIVERCKETDNGSPRAALAIVMFMAASKGTPADLADKLTDLLDTDEAKDLARNEWIPQATGKDGRVKSYEPILASADAGRRPDLDFVLVIQGPQYPDSILHDILGKNTDAKSFMRTRSPVLDAVENPLVHATPILGADVGGDVKVGAANPESRESGDAGYGEDRPEPTPTPTPTPIPPGPYAWQNM